MNIQIEDLERWNDNGLLESYLLSHGISYLEALQLAVDNYSKLKSKLERMQQLADEE